MLAKVNNICYLIFVSSKNIIFERLELPIEDSCRVLLINVEMRGDNFKGD